MRKYFVVLLMLLALGMTAGAASQHHRHHPRTSVNINVNKDSANMGITAYSDTTDTDTAQVDSANDASYDDDHYSSSTPPEEFFKSMADAGIAGGAIAFLVSLVVIIAILSPVLIVAIVLYFIFRNRNQRYKLAQAAIASGKAVPHELLREDRQSDDFLWSKGIKTASIGLGLVFFFWILGAEPLIGVGLLVFCMGVGQAIIAKTTKRKTPSNQDFDHHSEAVSDDEVSSTKMEEDKPSDTMNDEQAPSGNESTTEKQ